MTVMEPNAALGADSGIEVQIGLDQEALPEQRGDGGSAGDPSASAPEARGTAEVQDVDAWTDTAAGADQQLQPIGPIVRQPIGPIVRQPITFPTRRASGTYRSTGTGFQLEVRVDVDGTRPLQKVSGDYYVVTGTSTSHYGSFTVDAVTVSTTASTVTIVGTARTTWSTTFNVVRVTIPRTTVVQPAGAATVRWSTSSGAIGSTYTCPWQRAGFRTVELEQDVESGVTAFTSYNTGALTSGGPARVLTVGGAYEEAGVAMLDTGATNTITTPAGHVWNNASLHNAMRVHFSRWRDTPQFKVWLLHARAHEYGTGLRGIMFDQQGLQRQGCASFYQMISAGTNANRREQLYVHVHELGHCFNLYHSFHKTSMKPPLPNRPGSLSWMNYPQNYNPGGGAPSGAAAFWSAFPFQFDNLELAHLRHGFRNDVIMGGNPFGTGAAMDAGDEFGDVLSDTSGITLRIAVAPERPVLGEPVVLEIEARAEPGRLLHRRDQLHPKFGLVNVAIRRPRGDVVVHRPPLAHCAEPEIVTAGFQEEQPTSAYIGFDAAVGQVFEDPGTYQVRAVYAAPEGALVLSNVASVRISAPHSREEDAVAELMLQDDTGMVLTVLGSDSAYLATGTEALETVLAEHADSPVAVYARLAQGMNAARPFTEVRPDGSVHVRPRDLERADALLTPAVDASRGDDGLDDLTVLQVLGYLARSHAEEGDAEGARALRTDAVDLAQEKDAPASVIDSL
jgi:hypothetical protein